MAGRPASPLKPGKGTQRASGPSSEGFGRTTILTRGRKQTLLDPQGVPVRTLSYHPGKAPSFFASAESIAGAFEPAGAAGVKQSVTELTMGKAGRNRAITTYSKDGRVKSYAEVFRTSGKRGGLAKPLREGDTDVKKSVEGDGEQAITRLTLRDSDQNIIKQTVTRSLGDGMTAHTTIENAPGTDQVRRIFTRVEDSAGKKVMTSWRNYTANGQHVVSQGSRYAKPKGGTAEERAAAERAIADDLKAWGW